MVITLRDLIKREILLTVTKKSILLVKVLLLSSSSTVITFVKEVSTLKSLPWGNVRFFI